MLDDPEKGIQSVKPSAYLRLQTCGVLKCVAEQQLFFYL